MTNPDMDKKIVQAAGKKDHKELEKLVAKGANVNAFVLLENTGPKRSPLINAIACNTHDNVQWLVNNKADVNLANDQGMTPLMAAAWGNNAKAAKILLDTNARTNDKNHQGWSSLHFAAQQNAVAVVKLLVGSSQSCDVNALNSCGVSVLMTAAGNDSVEVIAELIAAGARTSDRDNKGWNALHFAAYEKANNVVEYLITRALIDMHSITKQGRTPLLIAASRDALDVVQTLISHGARAYDQDEGGNTALHIAAQSNAVQVVPMLLENRVSVHKTNKNGRTALMFAAASDHQKMVEVLLYHGARVNDKDSKDATAIHFCAEHNSHHVAPILIRHGATVLRKTKSGRTPVQLAEKKKNKEVLKILREQVEKEQLAPVAEEEEEQAHHGGVGGMLKSIYGYMSGMFVSQKGGEDKYNEENSEAKKSPKPAKSFSKSRLIASDSRASMRSVSSTGSLSSQVSTESVEINIGGGDEFEDDGSPLASSYNSSVLSASQNSHGKVDWST